VQILGLIALADALSRADVHAGNLILDELPGQPTVVDGLAAEVVPRSLVHAVQRGEDGLTRHGFGPRRTLL